jgi:chromate transporter
MVLRSRRPPPGPLIIVVAFVGFMAGFRNFHDAILIGTLALLLTTLYTFLPGYLFVSAGIPLVRWTQHNRSMKAVSLNNLRLRNLDWIAIAVVGLSLFLLGTRRTKVGAVIGLSLGFEIAPV